MSDDFDAYYQWLGIAPRDQPPNHYRLLGVDLFESSPDVIETAADRQMIHIRTFQSGPNGDASQKLLNEIATAKLCLLNAAKKAEYDAKLRADQEAATRPQARALRGGSSAPLTQMPEGVADFGPPMPRPPPGAFDVRSADSSVLSDGLSLRRSTARTNSPTG